MTDAYGYPDALLVADGFAQALAPVAAREVAFIEPGSARDEMVERVVVGTLVYERALAATRRLLLEHLSASRFADG